MKKHWSFRYETAEAAVDFEYAGDLWITDITSLSGNTVSISESQSVNQVGATITANAIQPRDLTVDGAIAFNVEASRAALLAAVLPGVPARFYYTDRNDKTVYLEGYPRQTPVISNDEVSPHFQFVLHCPFPYWISEDDNILSTTGLTSLFSFPGSFDTGVTFKLSEIIELLIVNAINQGNTEMGFDVTFRATNTVVNPRVVHIDSQQYIGLDYTMASGDAVRVSTRPGKKGAWLIQGGVETKRLDLVDVDSNMNMILQPGDNLFGYEADAGKSYLQIIFNFPKGVYAGV